MWKNVHEQWRSTLTKLIKDQLHYERTHENEYPQYPRWNMPITLQMNVMKTEKRDCLVNLKRYYEAVASREDFAVTLQMQHGTMFLKTPFGLDSTIQELIERYRDRYSLPHTEIAITPYYKEMRLDPTRQVLSITGLSNDDTITMHLANI